MGARPVAAVLLSLGLAVPVGARADEARADADVTLDHPVLVVTAAPPLDGERLAAALRAYLDELHVEVRSAPAAPTGELRGELAATARIGAAVRAWAVVRIADGAPGSAEIELVDRVTDKSLVTIVPRPRRDEDLYRAVALKVQALLRATLAEPGAPVGASPALARLAEVSVAPAPPAPPEHALGLETAISVVAFPSGGLVQRGLAVSLTHALHRYVEVAVGTEVLSAIRVQSGAVDAAVSRVPFSLAARVKLRSGRWEGSAGPVGEAALVSIDTSSATLAVRSGWSVVPAVGGQVGGRFRLTDRTWLCARAAALGVIVAQRFTAQGQPLLTLSGLQAGFDAGVGVDLW